MQKYFYYFFTVSLLSSVSLSHAMEWEDPYENQQPKKIKAHKATIEQLNQEMKRFKQDLESVSSQEEKELVERQCSLLSDMIRWKKLLPIEMRLSTYEELTKSCCKELYKIRDKRKLFLSNNPIERNANEKKIYEKSLRQATLQQLEEEWECFTQDLKNPHYEKEKELIERQCSLLSDMIRWKKLDDRGGFNGTYPSYQERIRPHCENLYTLRSQRTSLFQNHSLETSANEKKHLNNNNNNNNTQDNFEEAPEHDLQGLLNQHVEELNGKYSDEVKMCIIRQKESLEALLSLQELELNEEESGEIKKTYWDTYFNAQREKQLYSHIEKEITPQLPVIPALTWDDYLNDISIDDDYEDGKVVWKSRENGFGSALQSVKLPLGGLIFVTDQKALIPVKEIKELKGEDQSAYAVCYYLRDRQDPEKNLVDTPLYLIYKAEKKEK